MDKISIANKGIGTIKRLYKFLPRSTLINTYKAFVRPHLDYGDIIYDNSSNASLSQMIESVQYNAALAITSTIRGSSREKLYQELGLESLRDRRWYRKLCFYYKIRHNDCPQYLAQLLPTEQPSCYSLQFILHLLLTSELNVLNHLSFLLVFLIGTNLILPFKILLRLKYLNEHYLNLFALKQLMCTRFTTREG